MAGINLCAMSALSVVRIDAARAFRPGEALRIQVGRRSAGDLRLGLADPWARIAWTRTLAPGGPVGIVQPFGEEDLSGTWRVVVEEAGSRRLLPFAFEGAVASRLRMCLTLWLDVERHGLDPVHDASFLLSFPASSGPRQVLESVRTNVPSGISTDLAGNPWLRVTEDSVDSLRFRYDAVLRTRAVLHDVDAMRRGGPDEPPLAPDLAFVRPERGIESDDAEIRRAAAGLPGQRPEDIVVAAHSFVRSNVRYRLQAAENGALAALRSGEGDCTELAALLVALVRARGVPARVVLGRFVRSAGLHAIAEVRILGQWMPVDVTNRPTPTFGMGADWLTLFPRNWMGEGRSDARFSVQYRSHGAKARLRVRDRQRLRRIDGPPGGSGIPIDLGPVPGPFSVSIHPRGRSFRLRIESRSPVPLAADLLLSVGTDAIRVIRAWPLMTRPGVRLEREVVLADLGALAVVPEELRADLVDRTGRVLCSTAP